MLLAELNIRHSRRHMPTRRVALGDTYLPLSGPAWGAVLLGGLVAEHYDALDEDQLELLPRLVHDAAGGLTVPASRCGIGSRPTATASTAPVTASSARPGSVRTP